MRACGRTHLPLDTLLHVSQNLNTLFAGGRVGRVSARWFSLLLVPPASAWIVFPLVFAVEVKGL